MTADHTHTWGGIVSPLQIQNGSNVTSRSVGTVTTEVREGEEPGRGGVRLRRGVLRADVQFPLGGVGVLGGGGVAAVRYHSSEGGEGAGGVEEAVLGVPRPFGRGHHGLKP